MIVHSEIFTPATPDAFRLAGVIQRSRLILGTARYPSPDTLRKAIGAAGANLVTVSLRRHCPEERGHPQFWDLILGAGVTVLPNTAGCRSAKEAVTTAHMARELFATNWIKLEVVGDDESLHPDPFGLVEAARILSAEDFVVFPYTTDDLVVAERLIEVGCNILMPWGAPIGTGRGLSSPVALRALRARFPAQTLIVDAGLGAPSHAAAAMELGFDGVLLNTAVARAAYPVAMAHAFALAVRAGRAAYAAGLMTPRERATESTPMLGRPFWRSPS
jgi:thiazole synthase